MRPERHERAKTQAERPALLSEQPTPNTEHPIPNTRFRRRRLILLAALVALLILAGEIAWFSDPVQDWWIGRQPLSRLRQLVEEQPGLTRARYFYSLALLRAGRPEEALEHARAATVMDRDSARLFAAAGLAAHSAGQAEESWDLLSRARELGEKSDRVFEAMAVIQMEGRHFGQAVRTLEESLRIDPRRPESWYFLGQCRGALGMPQGWTEAMERATALRPREPRYWRGLAEAWLFRDRPDEALRAAERALAVRRDDPESMLSRARCLGALARTDAEITAAHAAFRDVLRRARADPSIAAVAWREWGRFLLEQGRAREAVAAFERAWDWDPEDQRATYALAQAYRRVGAAKKADAVIRRFERSTTEQRDVRYLQSRVTADPRNADLQLAVARRLARLGRKREADFYYRNAIRLRPELARQDSETQQSQVRSHQSE